MVEYKANFEIIVEEERILVNINPKIYDLQTVYTTCYTFLEKAFVLIDGDPEHEFIVEIKPKELKGNNDEKKLLLEQFARGFNNELIRFGFYSQQNKKTIGIKTLMMQRIMGIDDGIANIYVEKKLASDLRKQEELLNYNPLQDENNQKDKKNKDGKNKNRKNKDRASIQIQEDKKQIPVNK